ncbi:TIGR02450 family Trp-rich protein [Aeromonas diversa]|uniref:TIGR02450 family Trp-rich protein n=1 Tax=Aeromonas diversa TaxID=502790 RepID=UPI0034629204
MGHSETLLFTKWTREADPPGVGVIAAARFLVVACRRNATGVVERVTLQNVNDLSEMEVESHELQGSGRWHRGWD